MSNLVFLLRELIGEWLISWGLAALPPGKYMSIAAQGKKVVLLGAYLDFLEVRKKEMDYELSELRRRN